MKNNSIKLIFSGDFAPIGRMRNLQEIEYNEVFKELSEVFLDSDIHITNLECPLTNHNKPIIKTGPAIRSTPESILALKTASVDIACLANNHFRDYGDIGITDTIKTCLANGIETLGAGMNKKVANRILYKLVKGLKIGFINCCETEFSVSDDFHAGSNPADPIELYYKVQEARNNANYVFLIYHGGYESYPLPDLRIKKLFHFFADIGVSAVIGHHSHVISGYEIYKGVPLIYSLGNFVFDEPDNINDTWFKGLLAEILLDNNKIDLKLHFIEQSKEVLGIRLLKESEHKKASDYIIGLSKIIENDELLNESWIQFADNISPWYLKTIYGLNSLGKFLLKCGVSIKRILKKTRLTLLLNIIRNESHRELLIYSLK